jgi:hypothetical protein
MIEQPTADSKPRSDIAYSKRHQRSATCIVHRMAEAVAAPIKNRSPDNPCQTMADVPL